MSEDFRAQWRERLASGSKLAARALVQALKEDDARVALVAPLVSDPLVTVRVSTLRALGDIGDAKPHLVAPYARDLVQALGSPEPDAQAAALHGLAAVAHHAPAEAALALPLIADLLRARRPGLREEAARCLGRLGQETPSVAPDAARRLADALAAARSPRAAQEAREILAALEGLVANLPPPERQLVAARVSAMRGHPNLQVRERAGRVARALSA
ncbi:MAG TPA: hypothetical protein VHH36_00470 [Candidatus Thermoplasmatota archaeon]|nr:hypothetical protein [Candidatus Thermoplasmatota archaeon]